MSNLIEVVKAPEAEISLVEGQSKIIQSRRADADRGCESGNR